MKTGNGKIANLPAELRDQLNFRLSDGDPGNELVAWLNSKPEVADVVNKLFDGTPISEQNLSEWRKRGYQKWLAHRNFVDESNAIHDNSPDLAATGIDCDKLLLTLTAAYAEMIRNWIITPGEQMTYKLAVYKNLTNGVIALQRAELQKVRLEIARERLELLREKRLNKSHEAIGGGALRQAQGLEPLGELWALSLSKRQAKRVETAGGGPGKGRASSAAPLPLSTQDTSRESAASSSFACPEAPEPHRSAIPAPPLCGETDPPHPATAVLPPAAEESARTPRTQATPSVPTVAAQSAPPRPAPATPANPVAPQGVPLWPNRRPGGPPRNASPRNPLGLL